MKSTMVFISCGNFETWKKCAKKLLKQLHFFMTSVCGHVMEAAATDVSNFGHTISHKKSVLCRNVNYNICVSRFRGATLAFVETFGWP